MVEDPCEESPGTPEDEVVTPKTVVDEIVSTERKLHEIRNAKPSAHWVTYVNKRKYGIVVSLPHNCFVSATLQYLDESCERSSLYLDMISVSDELKKNGIGTRLLQSLIREAKEFGAVKLEGNVTGKVALATIAKVCGENNLQFFNRSLDGEGKKLNLTFEETMNEENLNCMVVSDLANVDESKFEKSIRASSEL